MSKRYFILSIIKILIFTSIKMNLAGFEFSIAELIISGVFIVAFLYQFFFYLRYINAPLATYKKLKRLNSIPEPSNEGVSVIICARDEADNLRKNIPLFMEQDYDKFELIVVNDGSLDDTELLLTNLKEEYPKLRSTFVPYGATNLSTKKLALTLGIKAARYDWVLLTDADCMPEGNQWISSMARNFRYGTEFVLGYAPYLHKKTVLNKIITYDTLFNGLQYLGFAIHGHPYMGVGRNMAYRKEVFFRNKGFASNLHLRSGDDDLIVNHSANAFNTKVELARESLTWSEPEKKLSDWLYQKERHLSVSGFYKSSSKFRLVTEPSFRGIFYLSFLLMLILGNPVTKIAAGVFYLFRLFWQLLIINKASKHFGGRNYFISIIVYDIYLPLLNMYLMTFGRMGSKSRRIVWK